MFVFRKFSGYRNVRLGFTDLKGKPQFKVFLENKRASKQCRKEFLLTYSRQNGRKKGS